GARANRRGSSRLVGLLLALGLRRGGSLGRLGGLGGLLRGLVSLVGLLATALLLRGDGLDGGLLVRGGERLVEQLLLGLLLRARLQRAFGTGQALVLLPVTGDLEDALHRLGGQCADAQPVLGALGVDLDEARLFLGVVLADRLDGLAIPAGARV